MADNKKATPAVMYMDGVEFMPANKNVLFGFQFKSICGLGPVVGAIMAVNWGWLPAMLYLFLGVAFIGWIHDYTASMVGVRKEGMSLGGMSYTLISPRARTLISVFIYFNLMLSFGAFALLIAGNLTQPHGPLGIIIWVLMGLLCGQMIYKWKQSIVTTTLVTVVVTFIGIFLLTNLPPVAAFFKAISGGDKPPIIFGSINQPTFIWVIAVLIFCYFGAVLPIWRWAQPMNYLGFWVVFIGMVMISLGILFWNPSFENFPAYKGWWWGNNPLWPILFVTMMCGAISGWHSLVSSSGTARMIEKETDTLPVAGGAMLLEMIMGLLALIIAVSAFGSYEGYAAAFKKGAGAVFMVGGANFLGKIGIPAAVAGVYANAMFAIIGLTLIHLGVRFMRLYGADVLGEYWPIFKNVQFSAVFTIIIFAVFCFTGVLATLWFLGGAFNQMLASMALLISSCWLAYERKNYKITLYPSIFLFVTTISAAIWISYNTIKHFFVTPNITTDRAIGDWLTGLIALFLVYCAVVLIIDAFAAIRKFTSERGAAAPAPAPGGGAK
jgi:carbon starvation protein